MPTGIYIRTKKHNKNISKTLKKTWVKIKNSACTLNRNKKISKANKGRLSPKKNKNYEEFYGIKRSKEIKIKQSKAKKGKIFSQQHCKNISISQSGLNKNKTYEERLGAEKAKKCKIKQRLKAIQRIENNYGKCEPNYNLKACKVLRQFDKINNTKGQYAVYGDGEYLIKGLHYFLDYINFDKKLIIEIDEKHHFDKFDNLKLKDIERQQEIQKIYPDFKFLRFKDKEMDKILEIKI